MTRSDVEAWLRSRDHDELVRMLVEQASADETLGRRLRLEAARSRSKRIDLAPYRTALRLAVLTDDFIDYRHMGAFAHGIGEAVAGIEELLAAGHAVEAIELTEEALEMVEVANESCDDSDGHLGGILEELQGIHLRACRKARPDPKELAARLFEKELATGLDVFYNAAATYASLLGPEGLAAYRKLAEERWSALRPLGPGDREDSVSGERFRITSIMTALARQTGDVEDLVAVEEKDLSSPYRFLQVAETYDKAGKPALALEWAERGIAAFPDKPDARLSEFLADRYHALGRHEEAMALIWSEFARHPYLDAYQTLSRHARRARSWPAWREKALALVRKQLAASKASEARGALVRGADHSCLVEIFLWEKDSDAAWTEAKAGGCTNQLWLELARQREKDHPEDALSGYLSQVEPTLRLAKNDAYRAAVSLLKRIQSLLVRLGRGAEFDRYLGSLRTAHKAKRNLLRLLDQTSWR